MNVSINGNSTFLWDGSRLHVEVITLAYLCTELLSGLPFIGPAFDTALEDIKSAYPGINLTQRIVGQNITDCNVGNFLADSERILAEFYFRLELQRSKQFDLTVFVTAGVTGSDDALGAARFALGVKKLLITSAISKSGSGFPATADWITTTVSSMTAYLKVYEDMVRMFNWTDIMILRDSRGTRNPFQDLAANFIQKRLEASRNIRMTELKFDSLLFVPVDYVNILRNVSQIARVVFYFASWPSLQDVQVGVSTIVCVPCQVVVLAAVKLNMTNGEYVFIGLIPFRFPSLAGTFKWLPGDLTGQATHSAFRNFILIENLAEQNEKMSHLQADWKQISRVKYNYKYPPDDPVPPYATSSYGAMMALAQVLDELRLRGLKTPLDGHQVARAFLNRTFVLRTGKLNFNEYGDCVPYVAVTQTDVITGNITMIMQLDAETSKLMMTHTVDWPSAWPVQNEPKCGFTGDSVRCRKKDNSFVMTFGASFGTVFVLTLIGALLAVFKYRNWNQPDAEVHWWELECNALSRAWKESDGMNWKIRI